MASNDILTLFNYRNGVNSYESLEHLKSKAPAHALLKYRLSGLLRSTFIYKKWFTKIQVGIRL